MRTFFCLPLLAFALAGCSGLKHADTTRFYALAPAATESAASTRFAGLLFVAPVELASYLDSPAIVLRIGTNLIEFAEGHHWAQPVRDNVTQVLRENLASVLGTGHVHPLERQRPRSAFIGLQVRLDQCELLERKQAVLGATWQLTDGSTGKVLKVQTTRVEKPLAARSDDFASHVSVLSEALAELSQTIAGALKELPVPAE